MSENCNEEKYRPLFNDMDNDDYDEDDDDGTGRE